MWISFSFIARFGCVGGSVCGFRGFSVFLNINGLKWLVGRLVRSSGILYLGVCWDLRKCGFMKYLSMKKIAPREAIYCVYAFRYVYDYYYDLALRY